MKKMNADDVPTLSLRERNEHLYVLPDNAQHIGDREEQQDYFAYSDLMNFEQIQKLGCTAVLADGMGGMMNGRRAAMVGVDTFLENYCSSMENGSTVYKAMHDALLKANEAVFSYPGSGATLVSAVVKENELHWISVGDSHLYLFRKGLLRLLNTDHIYAKELDTLYRHGEITLEEATNHPEREALTSYLGMPELTLVDCSSRPLPMRMGDVILLCSDGLYRTLTTNEIADVLNKTLDNAADRLVEAALSKSVPGQDNLTAVMLKII